MLLKTNKEGGSEEEPKLKNSEEQEEKPQVIDK